MKILRYFTIFVFIFCNSFFYSHSQDIQQLMNYAETYQFDKLEEALETLPEGQKDSITTFFLKALIERDGDKAVEIYNKIINSDARDITKVKSLWRIAQYYYIKGLYNQSLDLLEKIISNFPTSMYAKKAQEQLEIIKYVSGEKAQEIQKPQIKEKEFTLQLGAFSNKQNAENRAKFLRDNGYKEVKIYTKSIGGNILYLVWLGNFNSENSARESGELIKRKLRIDYRIVEMKD